MSPWRARTGLAAGVLAWLVATWLLARAVAGTPSLGDRSAGVDEALVTVAALLGLAVLAWFAAAFTATALAVVLPRGGRGRGAAYRVGGLLTPVAARRFLSLVVAAALVTGVTPAHAVTRAPGPVVTSSAPASPASPSPGPGLGSPGPGLGGTAAGDGRAGDGLDPGWAPSTPSTPSAPSGPSGPSSSSGPSGPSGPSAPSASAPSVADRRVPGPARYDAGSSLDPAWGLAGRLRPGVDPEETLVVRRGDTLWDIAARHLGPGATDAEIAHAWPLWYAANRSTIGPDPDRLSPGQRLRPPAPTPGG